MKKLVLHPATQRQIKAFVNSPGQVVLVAGPAGAGKLSLAKGLAEAIIGLDNEGFDKYEYGLLVPGVGDGEKASAGQSIGIDLARQTERFMHLKVPVDRPYNRAVIIENSHLMTIEAQNALLKTLEEPPAGTLIIMTVSYEPALLPTVRSRAQTISVQRPDQAKLNEFFASQGFNLGEVDKLYALSGGLPGLMSALLNDDEHPLKLATEQARQLLSHTQYERLIAIDTLAKDKALAADTLTVLQRMARLSLQTATGNATERWQKVLKASYQAAAELTANAQPKLVLTNLALRI